MMKKYIKNKHFTLIEILISMGVFLVLLTLLLNFFSGTRLVWKTLRERNEAFENSRVAMNLITDLMQCSLSVRRNEPQVFLPGISLTDPPVTHGICKLLPH